MKVDLKKEENNLVTLEIEVDDESFDKAIEMSYKKNVKKMNIPGFRKGKAPRKLIEAKFGEEIFYEDAVNFVLPDAYSYAIEETKIEPVSQPEFDVLEIGKDKPLKIKAEVYVKPEVKLGEYKGLEVEKNEYEVTEESVNMELENIRQRNARLVTVSDREAKQGDTLTIDFEGFKDGEAFEGGKAENYNLELGSNTFIPGFEEQLIGCNIEDEKEVNVTFPEEYNNEELSGKDALFKVKVKEIKTKELPDIDDEFAKDVSEFETLEEYKEDIKNNLENRLKEMSEKELKNSIVDKIVENSEVDVPDVMVDEEINNIINNMAMKLQYQGLNLDKYLEFSGKTKDDLKEEYKDNAYNNVKSSLVLEKITKEEKVEISDEEVDEKIKEMAESYKKDPKEMKKSIGNKNLEFLKDSILTEKTIDFLTENSKIKVKKQKDTDINNKE